MDKELLQYIKDVAIYLRKSRGKDGLESDEVLEKHRNELVEFAEKHNLRYTIYPEVVSGDRINERPEMIKLLEDVQEGLWDAVLCIDIQRLGRGDEEDQGKIKRIFRNSETFIMTPDKLYNLENEDDETYLEFQTFLSRQEFKLIKKRFQRGKKQGARAGNWTNGTPPYPYEYDSNTKGLIIDENKLLVYNLIKNMFLNELLPLKQIEWKLNQKNIPSPRNKKWNAKVIKDILCSEIHLGRIISNKSKGNYKKGEKIKLISRDKWIVVENCHKATKTLEEHEKIIEILSKRNYKVTSRPKRILSGLVECGLCHRIMQLHSNKYSTSLTCPGYSPVGEKCPCIGIAENKLIEKLLPKIDSYFNENYICSTNNDNEIDLINKQLDKLSKESDKIQNSIDKIFQMREDGEYTKEEFLERKEKRLYDLNQVKNEIQALQEELSKFDENNVINRINNYYIFKKNWYNALNDSERNLVLSQLIDRVFYIRTKENQENIDIQVKFK